MDNLEYLTPEQIAEYNKLAYVSPAQEYVWQLLEENIIKPEYRRPYKEKCLYTSTEIAMELGLVPFDTKDSSQTQIIRLMIGKWLVKNDHTKKFDWWWRVIIKNPLSSTQNTFPPVLDHRIEAHKYKINESVAEKKKNEERKKRKNEEKMKLFILEK